MAEDREPLSVFISFAEQDRELLQALEAQLFVLAQSGQIRIWHRDKLRGGDSLGEMEGRRNQADLILLLLSPYFIASNWESEIEPAMALRQRKETLVVPVLLRPVAWEGSSLGALQPLPKNRQPVTSWGNTDQALLDVAEGLRQAVEIVRSRRPRTVEPEAMPKPATGGNRVFLCYDPADRSAVDALYGRLQEVGFEPWAVHRDLLPGQNRRMATSQALRSSRSAVVCLSSTFVSRAGESQRQLKEALDVRDSLPEGALFLIPARLDDSSIPDSLTSYQAVDLFRSEGFSRLTQALEIGGSGARPTPPPEPRQTPPEGPTSTSSTGPKKRTHITASEVKGKVDIGILTVRIDEFEAVLQRFSDQVPVTGGRNLYQYAEVKDDFASSTRVVIARIPEQGPGIAQTTTRDLIEDVDPKWIFLVGIAGGTPDHEYSLGDIVLAKRLHDFSVTAAYDQGHTEYQDMGGGMHRKVLRLVSFVPAMKSQLGEWNSTESIGRPKPPVDLDDETRFYGDEAWQKDVRESLERNFPPGHKPRRARVWEGATVDAGTLVKDPDLLSRWQGFARDTRAVEMELGGVYQAAQSGDQAYPVLAIRALSDIVGYQRHPDWTQYACDCAAAFARALLQSGMIHQ